MDNDQASRASLSNGDLRRFQWLPLANPSQPDEGGLNLGQVVALCGVDCQSLRVSRP
ncbi:hypothetical protein [Leptodesmis sp.]|uniref:hypothetical protein n=1 Tax=Leptodesmis sp. TaxID=3100501 RepID=UPI0040534973